MTVSERAAAMPYTRFITDKEIYQQVILDAIPSAKEFVWIATADLKDLYVSRGKKMRPFLGTISELLESGVLVRLIHAKEPGPAFREDFDRYPNLIESLERMLCPRVHFKSVVVDGKIAYTGSANLTGAGMGAKGEHRRNFEAGILTTDPAFMRPIMEQFDGVWMGARCVKCQRKKFCADYKDILPG
jgi:phosphatidylserine/phosphatidylglycerophosphate/cardiolipin synthase-like enzyme